MINDPLETFCKNASPCFVLSFRFSINFSHYLVAAPNTFKSLKSLKLELASVWGKNKRLADFAMDRVENTNKINIFI